MKETTLPAIGLEHWEDDEYVVTLDGKPCGKTLHLREVQDVGAWLATALQEISEALEAKQ